MENSEGNKELTIVSVYHNSLSKNLLEASCDLTGRLNPGAYFEWLAGDNTRDGIADRADPHKFSIVRNTSIDEYRNLVSQHHASGINKCLPRVKTRFFLSLDSDFFIIRPYWIKRVLSYMKEKGLAFFGVPYYVKDWQKYRYFPSVVGMFVDLDKVPLSSIDFTPGYELDGEGRVVHVLKRYAEGKSASPLRRAVGRRLPASIKPRFLKFANTFNLGARWKSIATARDTGYRIYERCGRVASLRSECVTAVFRREQITKELYPRLNDFFELFLPERLCYLPKDKSYYTSAGFRERSYPDVAAFGWEEYFWREEPFGIHVHGSSKKLKKRRRSEAEEIERVRALMNDFAKRAGF